MKTVRVSPSQIQLASLCWRKWAFAYILGLRESETWQLALGTFVHSLLEAYLDDGTVPDPNQTWTHEGTPRTFYPGKIALNMMPAGIFPAPGIGHVEHRFEYDDGRGILWNGLLDWHTFNPDAPAAEFESVAGHEERGLIVVIDHKTSSDPRRWGKLGDDDSDDDEYEERQLHNDVQAIVYARAMLDKYGPANVVAHWNYGSTKGVASHSRVATTRYVPGEVYALFENRVRPVATEIRRLRLLNADPLSLDPNPDACSAYHKQCPHVDTCNLTTAQRIGNIVMGNPLVDSLIQQAANAGAAPVETPEARVAEVVEETAQTVEALREFAPDAPAPTAAFALVARQELAAFLEKLVEPLLDPFLLAALVIDCAGSFFLQLVEKGHSGSWLLEALAGTWTDGGITGA